MSGLIDPLTTLAFAIEASPGVYAFLLGSGVSRSAAVPTGWEVVLDLVRKVAAVEGNDAGEDPAGWYRSEKGGEPSYGELLAALATTQAERQAILRGYFEPSEEERSNGIKAPTPAHRAIAQLVGAGYVRVVITTNFDRLLEMALADEGVAATVITNGDQARGAVPLAHSHCTVLKLHGDYLDTRIRNTEDELAKYEPAIDRLLDQVLDEYGLVVSGWSGESDVALRDAIARAPNRRFTTYWSTRRPLEPPAAQLAEQRRATVVPIASADDFFTGLAERVKALAATKVPDPSSREVAVALVKRYATDADDRVRMWDLVKSLIDRVHAPIEDVRASAWPTNLLVDGVAKVAQYDALTDTLAAAYAAGCYWAVPEHSSTWRYGIERLATADENGTESALRRYPALRLIYVGGLAAVLSQRYDTLAALLRARVQSRVHGVVPAIYLLRGADEALREGQAHELLKATRGEAGGRMLSAASEHFHAVSRPHILPLLGSPDAYDDLFDRLELLMAICFSDVGQERGEGAWSPLGRYGWRGRYGGEPPQLTAIADEVAATGEAWPPLLAGVASDKTRVDEALAYIREAIKRTGWGR